MTIYCVGKPLKFFSGQWISTVVVSFSFYSSGVAMAWTGPAFRKIEKGEADIKLTEMEMALVASIPFASRLLSPLPASYLMDSLGRRLSLILSKILQIVHWILLYFCYQLWELYLARFISGWFSGMGMVVIGVYVGETTDKKVRGRTQAMIYSLFILGTVFVTTAGAFLSYYHLVTVCLAVDIVTFLFLFMIPETPYFYLKKDRFEAAKKSLMWLRKPSDPEKELTRINRYLKLQLSEKSTYSTIFRKSTSRKAFIIVQALMILQRLSGMTAIVSYGTFIMPDTWWLPNDLGPVALNMTYLLSSILVSFFVDSCGRKTLLLVSSSGACAMFFGLTVWFYLDQSPIWEVGGTEWIPIIFLIIQASFYSIGYCYIPPLVMSEIFPMNIKAKANALGAMTATSFSMIIVLIFLPLTSACGLYANFAIYTVAMFVGALYSTTIIETRGKTLETIQANLEGRVGSDISVSLQTRETQDTEEL